MTLLAKTADLRQVGADLLSHYGPAGDNADFFDHDAVVIDSSKTDAVVVIEDLNKLMQALRDCRLQPVAFRGNLMGDASAALAMGLVMAPLEVVRSKPSPVEAKETAPAQAQAEVVRDVVHEVVREVIREIPTPAVPTMIIDKPVRSGQKVYARGADLVVLAMVNQGGEIVADGNIHVYAPLRGKAMAGASGNPHARIFSTCLEPELISIAGVYRTSENPLASEIQGKAAQVRLSADGQEKLLFEALTI